MSNDTDGTLAFYADWAEEAMTKYADDPVERHREIDRILLSIAERHGYERIVKDYHESVIGYDIPA